jgi:AraC-like DNA-binding protein
MGYIGLPVLKTGWATGPVPPQARLSLRARRLPKCSKNVQAGAHERANTQPVDSGRATISLLLEDGDLTVGEFTCPLPDARWRSENDIGEGFHVVFPWTPVHITRRSMPGMVATPNHAVLYPPRLRFHRRHLTGVGDHCLFAILSPRLCAALDLPQQDARLADPALTPRVWLAQRLLAAYLAQPGHDAALAGRLARALLAAAVRPRQSSPTRAAGPAVERTKELMATSTGELLPLERLAREAHYSRFHLLRAFHARTGYTVHQYHLQLRLRQSLGPVLDGAPLADVAFQLGFQGHSHFTARFHRAFGETPSGVRAAATGLESGPALVQRLLDAA